MGLDILATLLMWLAIKAENKKKKVIGSSLDNWGWLCLQILLVAAAFISMKSNPFPS